MEAVAGVVHQCHLQVLSRAFRLHHRGNLVIDVLPLAHVLGSERRGDLPGLRRGVHLGVVTQFAGASDSAHIVRLRLGIQASYGILSMIQLLEVHGFDLVVEAG